MNYTIAICDDEPVQVKIIEKYIEKFNKDESLNLIFSNSGEELLSKIKYKQIHICFLDIEMKGLNGIEIGKKLREIDKNVIIIFVTGFKEYALNAFEIKAFDYIMKPISEEKFKKLFQETLDRLHLIHYKLEKDKVFNVVNKEITYKIKYDDIYYFEKELRKIKVIHRGGSSEFYDSLKNLKERIDMNYFTQCHQGYIVSNNKILIYKELCITIEELGIIIPVSRQYVNDVKKVFLKNLFK
ncbi:LytTR family transcriptional regulator [Clostridium carboxidivorans P7]|uniref:Stage 0 sporulation protein A homolog n=1 Tax=Clostridium carboxidivorans P7 TaxID=536227 RepID=C6Q1S6_9CLOT|nr:LytTR family DNA-binding domain-containing protein [Clostridium carboxidivorans]AKN32903.1 LytTR family transcriptional regulator [Clostridium carboxidivorans P7]EET84543.1 two component transcriptional regulator, LytTR family [Clostridium carboxidivorans P7]EFG89843.1 response regulator receiver domain protein [Clostridium carboxidivorans P7]